MLGMTGQDGIDTRGNLDDLVGRIQFVIGIEDSVVITGQPRFDGIR